MRRGDRSANVIAFCEKYLVVPEGKLVGQKIKLRPWQRQIIHGIYDGDTRQAIASFARKNGKTSLVSMLVLAHLVGPETRANSQIYSAAQSRDQAAIVYGLASKMVRMGPLNDHVHCTDSSKALFGIDTGVQYKALSADATTAYGLSPALAIHDELGQVEGPRSELFEAIESAMGAQSDPLSIVISTQAPTDADLLSTLIDDAAAGAGKETKLFLWAAADTDDPWAEETWRKANPALGDFCSLEELRRSADRAKRLPAMEAAFRNLNLNQRVAAENHFVSASVWEQNAAPPVPYAFQSGEVYIGADLSASQDLTAVVAIARDGEAWHVKCWFFLPEVGLRDRARSDRVPYDLWAQEGWLTPVPGRVIDEDFVARTLAPEFARMGIRSIAYDRWQFESLRKAFSRAGTELPFLDDFGQGFKTMSPALKALETDLLAGRMRHGGNPLLTMCMANARVVIDDAGNRKLTKRRSTGRIDGAVALAMARGAAGQESPAEIDVMAMIA